jgi:hypothetical protein
MATRSKKPTLPPIAQIHVPETVQLELPRDLFMLIYELGRKFFTMSADGSRWEANPKYADAIVRILADEDEERALQLKKDAVFAYNDYALKALGKGVNAIVP